MFRGVFRGVSREMFRGVSRGVFRVVSRGMFREVSRGMFREVSRVVRCRPVGYRENVAMLHMSLSLSGFVGPSCSSSEIAESRDLREALAEVVSIQGGGGGGGKGRSSPTGRHC